MAVQSIQGVVQAAIESASKATGVDFGFLLGTAKRESGYNPTAKAPSSSASGLFQVVDQTWMAMLKKHGAQYGYANYANLISQDGSGRYYVAGADARKAVMDLKLEPQANSLMAAELANENAAYMKGRLGRMPSGGELYIAHFMGAQDGAKLIETALNNPTASAASLFPDAAGANHGVFYSGGRALSTGEVYANLTKTVNGAGVTQVASSNDGANQFLSYAQARRADQLSQQAMLVDMLLRGPEDQSPVSSYFSTGATSSSSSSQLASGLLSNDMMRLFSQGVDKSD